ncbi:Immuno-dominant variable surface antigen-like [Histomonas meleagridis]|uniref:Immuno-dominant variable surface antigen-like n=1 Tax=Histomonas meleagridis TaxID=135588 RepID=UPI00355A5174|nr:Immuno-dominant variable surface antigen-like [Histomonas meleagridis]KAH0802469.1 Immuno-dominant variable surface antigen-like [Histomonas meleagridis]
MLIQLLLTFIKAENFGRSVYGSPGIDDVNLQFHDGFEILEHNLKIPTRKHIKEANFTSIIIKDDDYPWPDHPYRNTCTWDLLATETYNVKKKYISLNVKQEELYWHPVAAKQYYTTQEEIDKMERVKVRYILAPKRKRHTTPFFLPPGEVITIEISEAAVSKNIRIDFNQNTETIWKGSNGEGVSKTRLNEILFEKMRLTKSKCTMGSPYGGSIYFHISSNDPVEINITGVIINPFFVYGVHSDTEWNNSLSLFKGPIFVFYTGNIEIVGYKTLINSPIQRINDCGEWLRSAYQIGQTTAHDSYSDNSKFWHIINPPQLTSETFIPAGSAVAIVAKNNCFFPIGTINSFVRHSSLMYHPWMIVHEMNHLRQDSWGKALSNNGWLEVTNNVINLIIYAQINEGSKTRTIDGASDWLAYANSFSVLNNNKVNKLRLYSIMLHYFGIEKMKQFIDDDQYDRYYPRNIYGTAGAEMLRASKVFGRNMKYHYNWEGIDDNALTKKAIEEIEKMKLPEFHPVTTAYGSGFLSSDTQGFITQRPFYLPNINRTIDFITTMYSISHDNFGKFEYIDAKFESTRDKFWIKQDKGKYIRLPFTNIIDVEEVIVSYKDIITNEITRCICQFKEYVPNAYAYRYYNIATNLNVKSAYQTTVGKVPDDIIPISSTDANLAKRSDGTVDVIRFRIRPPKNETYRFVLKAQGASQLYISKNDLYYDPSKDFVWKTESANYWGNSRKSDPIDLKTNEVYNIAFVMYTTNAATRGWLSYYEGNINDIRVMEEYWFVKEDIPDKDKFYSQFIPKKEKIYGMDLYDDVSFLFNDQSKWKVIKYPQTGSVFKDVTTSSQGNQIVDPTIDIIKSVLTDNDPATEYRTDYWKNSIPDFPHIYEIDLGDLNEFDSIYLAVSQNTNYFDVYGYLEISISNSEEKLKLDSSIVWKGYYQSSNPTISLGKVNKGKYLKLKFYNNTKTWKDGRKGRTSISELKVGYQFYTHKVIPITNTKVIKKSSKWLETRAGPYYNGKAFIGKPGEEIIYQIPIGQRAFGILGDYYKGIGYADVYLDDVKIGEIHDSIIPTIDNRKLKYASRAFRSRIQKMRQQQAKQYAMDLQQQIDERNQKLKTPPMYSTTNSDSYSFKNQPTQNSIQKSRPQIISPQTSSRSSSSTSKYVTQKKSNLNPTIIPSIKFQTPTTQFVPTPILPRKQVRYSGNNVNSFPERIRSIETEVHQQNSLLSQTSESASRINQDLIPSIYQSIEYLEQNINDIQNSKIISATRPIVSEISHQKNNIESLIKDSLNGFNQIKDPIQQLNSHLSNFSSHFSTTSDSLKSDLLELKASNNRNVDQSNNSLVKISQLEARESSSNSSILKSNREFEEIDNQISELFRKLKRNSSSLMLSVTQHLSQEVQNEVNTRISMVNSLHSQTEEVNRQTSQYFSQFSSLANSLQSNFKESTQSLSNSISGALDATQNENNEMISKIDLSIDNLINDSEANFKSLQTEIISTIQVIRDNSKQSIEELNNAINSESKTRETHSKEIIKKFDHFQDVINEEIEVQNNAINEFVNNTQNECEQIIKEQFSPIKTEMTFIHSQSNLLQTLEMKINEIESMSNSGAQQMRESLETLSNNFDDLNTKFNDLKENINKKYNKIDKMIEKIDSYLPKTERIDYEEMIELSNRIVMDFDVRIQEMEKQIGESVANITKLSISSGRDNENEKYKGVASELRKLVEETELFPYDFIDAEDEKKEKIYQSNENQSESANSNETNEENGNEENDKNVEMNEESNNENEENSNEVNEEENDKNDETNEESNDENEEKDNENEEKQKHGENNEEKDKNYETNEESNDENVNNNEINGENEKEEKDKNDEVNEESKNENENETNENEERENNEMQNENKSENETNEEKPNENSGNSDEINENEERENKSNDENEANDERESEIDDKTNEGENDGREDNEQNQNDTNAEDKAK